MDALVVAVLLALAVTLSASAVADTSTDGTEFVRNPGLSSAKGAALPEGWTAWLPDWEPARCTLHPLVKGLRIGAPGRPHAVGGVEQRIEGIAGGQAYAVEALCELRDIPFAYQAAVVRLEWTRRGESLHPAGLLVRGPFIVGGKGEFRDVLAAPKEADGALLRLEVRWPQGGSVLWQHASLRATDPPAPRKAKIGTVYLRPENSTPAKNLDLWCEQVAEAGRLGLDIVCLGEAILMVGTGASAADTAEAIPGPSTARLGAVAREHRIWVVAGLYERSGDQLYNTAVLIDREGKLAGTYRKVHLPREEWNKGIVPGSDYPVFGTDFGTIAIQICYDWFFPEIATIFAHKGAEIVFAPTWGNTLPDWDGVADGESVFRVRARDNGLYMVPSVYDGNSMVIDPMGRILASNRGRTGVFWAEVDLNTREPLPWVGYWRSIGPRDRMPATYAPLMSGPEEPTY
jgi:predicted amidohydrolase